MTTSSRVLILDVDGVLYPFDRELAKVAAAHYGRPLSDFPPATTWNFFAKDWGITLEDYLELFELGVQEYGLIRHGEPLADSIKGVNVIIASGAYVHIVTSLPDYAQAARRAWLAEHGWALSQLPVTFTDDKASVATSYLEQGYTVYALDDKVENVRALRETGASTWLLSQLWNEDEPGPRVDSVLELAQQIADDKYHDYLDMLCL